ncbi:MAG: ATP-binding protein, partial [Christensenellaceae bacterium]|nr:ATP-binding protein [Christensenellaceae bacterium]
DEAIETTKIHSVAGLLKDTGSGIITQRPFRSPHHTASAVSIIGGGHNSLPGEISLANNGVLFLDELPEYPRATLETLRQPLEDGNITVTRINRTVRYPANVMLVASMNPCPCGNKGSATRKCTCSLNDIKRYMDKLSGPLLDRFDICTPIDDISFDDYISTTLIEDSGTVRERIQRARKIQEERYKGTGIFTNARMTTQQLNTYCVLDKESENVLRNAFAKYNLTARGITRVKKIARTIADLNGRDKIAQTDIWEAISLRTGFSELG